MLSERNSWILDGLARDEHHLLPAPRVDTIDGMIFASLAAGRSGVGRIPPRFGLTAHDEISKLEIVAGLEAPEHRTRTLALRRQRTRADFCVGVVDDAGNGGSSSR
jgi:hypothetical protein